MNEPLHISSYKIKRSSHLNLHLVARFNCIIVPIIYLSVQVFKIISASIQDELLNTIETTCTTFYPYKPKSKVCPRKILCGLTSL
jgi:hypothetical protein